LAGKLRDMLILFFQSFFSRWLEDFLIFAGLLVAVVNTYLITVVGINILLGNYLLAIILLLTGIAVAKR